MANLKRDAKRSTRPSFWSAAELKKVGVSILDGRSGELICDKCGSTWRTNQPSRRIRSRGYWKSPKACNA
jgi:hypothetical protein